MRILFISNLYPPHDFGGMEQICEEIVERLTARGHVCHVLTSRFGLNGRPEVEENVTRAFYLEADVNYYRPLDFFLRRPWQERANRNVLRTTLDTFQPEVVFIWGMWNLSRKVAYWTEKWCSGKVAYNIQGYWPIELDTHRNYWINAKSDSLGWKLLRPFAKLAAGILNAEQYPPSLEFRHVSCCSQYVADALTDGGAISAGATVILNGIDPAPFIANSRQTSMEKGVIRLLYFGSLNRSKGVHTTIEALGLLQQREKADELQLTIVGGGHPDYEAHLRALAKALALESKVQFVSWVARSKVAEILSNHDVFLFTTISAEPFGRTIIEAMAAGLAVIGSDVGGSREIFQFYPEEMVFPANDAEALASQIERFIDDPDLIQRLGQAGKALVTERFTLDRMVDEMEAWLKGIVS